ncbi:DUF3141 domain-containing protein [Tropicimonas sp. S265A]|uniref:DUF3141 domain-containing protein n=1 Tax=Tropicimonas sp. S265A TaxID=3415134 RepID=UPI003C7C5F82
MRRTADYSLEDLTRDFELQSELMTKSALKRAEDAMHSATDRWASIADKTAAIARANETLTSPVALFEAWNAYLRDAAERAVLTTDTLRQWSDMQIAHQDAGAPPVLIYDYEVVMEGAALPRPSNYILLRILPLEGQNIIDTKRPYVIIDPRAGHGPGIGGFKTESQVGIALEDGHPVYFVAFLQEPQPMQTIADVIHSEAAFVREVKRRHPASPPPVIVGNCQGGWATAILAATHPELTGPIILNGAPMSYWAGKLGQYPMRYAGGLMGGVTPAVLASDLGGGIFDGANLVVNFEAQNLGRTWFRKYYDLFRDVDAVPERFLEFERWWTSFYLMSGEEIRWIVENLFVGNRLAKNEAQLEPGVPIDLKAIRAPIICFASHGDNITPPAQALNWILDTYANPEEIEISGQRIIYTVHENIGHLGIFVSSSVAKREHHEFVSTLKTIEAFPPGLYEMLIDESGDGIEVSFAKRTFEDVIAVTGLRRDEAAFAGAARASEAMAEVYDATVAPMVSRMITPEQARVMRDLHPARVGRRAFASRTPLMQTVSAAAAHVTGDLHAAALDNPFLLAERMWADLVETGFNVMRDWKEAATELSFFSIWAAPWAIAYGKPLDHTRRPTPQQELAPVIDAALAQMEEGGAAAGIVRLLILLAGTRKSVRLDRLARSSAALSTRAPFDAMQPIERAELIHEQQMIVRFARDEALESLPKLLKSKADKDTALDILTFVLGDTEEMAPDTREAWVKITAFLNDMPQAAAE